MLPFNHWTKVVHEAQNWGLLSPDPDIPRFLRLQPIFPYFLRNRLYAPEQTEVRSAVETAFREHFDQLGKMLHQLLKSKEPQERQVGQILTSLEYENLVTALNLALAAQVSILTLFIVLSTYLDTIQDQRRGLELGQTVLSSLEFYSTEKLAGQLGVEFASVIDDIAMRQLMLKQYMAAEESYQKALAVLLGSKAYDSDTIKKWSASIYHRLGTVAEEQRQWEQAELYHQQALQIYIEYNDRYAQAGTYGQLGLLEQERKQWGQARDYLLRALEIFFIAFKGNHYRGIPIRNLARLWKDSSDARIPGAIAPMLAQQRRGDKEAAVRHVGGGIGVDVGAFETPFDSNLFVLESRKGWPKLGWNGEQPFVILSVSEESRYPACEVLR